MKRFIKIFIFQLVISLLITVCYVVVNKDSLAKENDKKDQHRMIQAIMDSSDDKPKEFTLAERKAGVKKFDQLCVENSTREALFEAVKDNYEFTAFILESSESNMSTCSVDLDYKLEKIADYYPEYNTLLATGGLFTVKRNDNEKKQHYHRFVGRISQKKYLPLKGDFKYEFFCKKVESLPVKNSSSEVLNFTFRERFRYQDSTRYLHRGGSSNSEKDSVIERKVCRDIYCFKEPGTYAVQLHLYPDELMSKSIEGIIKSPVYYVNVEDN